LFDLPWFILSTLRLLYVTAVCQITSSVGVYTVYKEFHAEIQAQSKALQAELKAL